jgi:hypothetical protein
MAWFNSITPTYQALPSRTFFWCFKSFLRTLFPLCALVLILIKRCSLDVLPVTTLAEWTDVLHLSFLWGVEHVRTAAIKAILPLASAVDKLVLGRAYEISDWIPGAYADVLERAEDLSVADIRRMNAEDIAAVARGRREARTERVRPRTDIEEIVRDLLLGASDKASPPSKDTAGSPPGNDQSLNIPSLDSPASIPGDAAQAPPHERDGLEGAKLKISRWLGQLSACLAAQSVPVECLVVYMRSDLARVPLVIDEILRRGLDDFIRTIDRKGRLFRAHDDWYLTYTNGWHSGSDGGRFGDLLALNTRDGSLGVVRSRQTKEACIRLVDNWNLLKRPDLKISMNELVSSDTWRRMLAATKYIAYLVDGPSSTNARSNSVVQPSVFASFWMALAKAYRSTKHEKMLPLVASTQSLLAEVGVHVSRVAVGTEMDEFYQVLEEVRKTEKERLWIVEGLEGTLDVSDSF